MAKAASAGQRLRAGTMARRVIGTEGTRVKDWLWIVPWMDDREKENRNLLDYLDGLFEDREFMIAYCHAILDLDEDRIAEMFPTIKEWDKGIGRGELERDRGDRIIKVAQEAGFPEESWRDWKGKSATRRKPWKGAFRLTVRQSFIGCFETTESDQEAARYLLGETIGDPVTIEWLLRQTQLNERTLRNRIRAAQERGDLVRDRDWTRVGRTVLIERQKGLELATVEEIPEGWVTVKQLVKECGIGESTLRARIRVARESGRLVDGEDWKRAKGTIWLAPEKGRTLAMAEVPMGRPLKQF